MDSVGLSVFVQASAAGSIAAAARRLRLSALTATRRLSALESALGVRLLNRTTRALSLTPEGEAFLPHAAAVLEAQAAAAESVRSDPRQVTGLLRVTTSAAFGRHLLTPILAEFMRKHPGVRVDLILTDTAVDLVAEGLDLAIRIASPGDSSLVGRRLADNRRDLYAAPAYLAEKPAPKLLADLARHDCLTLTGVERWSFTGPERPITVPIAGRFTANSIEGLHAACLSGLGVGLFSSWVVHDDVASGRLVRIQLGDAAVDPLAIWALHPPHRIPSRKVSAFVDLLRKRLAEILNDDMSGPQAPEATSHPGHA